MVIFVLTISGYKEMESLIKESNSPTWINEGILNAPELEELRNSGVDITNFTYHKDKKDNYEIQDALNTIREHHPGQSIWTEL